MTEVLAVVHATAVPLLFGSFFVFIGVLWLTKVEPSPRTLHAARVLSWCALVPSAAVGLSCAVSGVIDGLPVDVAIGFLLFLLCRLHYHFACPSPL